MSRYRSLSFHMSGNWNIFAGTNIFKHAELKSEKYPLRGPAVFSQIAILSSLILWQMFYCSTTRMDEDTRLCYSKDQFLLTSLLFNKKPFCPNHFELCNFMRVTRKQHNYLVCNFKKAQITLFKILSSSDLFIKSQGRYCQIFWLYYWPEK